MLRTLLVPAVLGTMLVKAQSTAIPIPDIGEPPYEVPWVSTTPPPMYINYSSGYIWYNASLTPGMDAEWVHYYQSEWPTADHAPTNVHFFGRSTFVKFYYNYPANETAYMPDANLTTLHPVTPSYYGFQVVENDVGMTIVTHGAPGQCQDGCVQVIDNCDINNPNRAYPDLPCYQLQIKAVPDYDVYDKPYLYWKACDAPTGLSTGWRFHYKCYGDSMQHMYYDQEYAPKAFHVFLERCAIADNWPSNRKSCRYQNLADAHIWNSDTNEFKIWMKAGADRTRVRDCFNNHQAGGVINIDLPVFYEKLDYPDWNTYESKTRCQFSLDRHYDWTKAGIYVYHPDPYTPDIEDPLQWEWAEWDWNPANRHPYAPEFDVYGTPVSHLFLPKEHDHDMNAKFQYRYQDWNNATLWV